MSARRLRLRIRLHGRGGQGVKTAGRMISTASFLQGYYSEDSPMYGPERRGAPVTSFVRVSSDPVEERGYIPTPDAVVLFEAPQSWGSPSGPLEGLRTGGAVIMNAKASPSDGPSDKALSIDVSGMARRILGKESVSAGVAAAVCRGLGIASKDNVRKAVMTELTEIGLTSEAIEKNLDLCEECYALVPVLQNLSEGPYSEVAEGSGMVEIGHFDPSASTAVVRAVGNSGVTGRGVWRISKPTIDYARCTNCVICFVYCPDSAISLGPGLKPTIDYDNCKGCLICMTECPLHAIAESRER